MILDGRMPSPAAAKAARAEYEQRKQREKAERRKKREQQPAQIRKREEKAEALRRWGDAATKEWQARIEENAAPPLYEVLADAFDFADPELWKSNSFTALRPRLVVHVTAVIANLEYKLATEIGRSPKPFRFNATTEERQAAAARRQAETSSAVERIEAELVRAREILEQLARGLP